MERNTENMNIIIQADWGRRQLDRGKGQDEYLEIHSEPGWRDPERGEQRLLKIFE